MMKMPTFLKALKVVVVNSLVFSLLQNPFISSAMAASDSTAETISKYGNMGLDLYQKYNQDRMQSQMDLARLAAFQKQMAVIGAGLNQTVPAKYFPECALPASMSTIPQNLCPSDAGDPATLTQVEQFDALAKQYMNRYEQMSNKNTNAPYPAGLRCLLDKQKALDSQITEMMNNLQRLQDTLNQSKQVFRDNNKKLLEDMNATHEELFGNSKSLGNKTRDVAKYFSQACQGVLGKENLERIKESGLNGALQSLSPANKSAGDFILNKNSIENDIRREAEKLANTIKANGVDDFIARSGNLRLDNESTAAVYGPAMMNRVGKTLQEFTVAKSRIEKDLSGIKNYKLPALDSRFSPDMEEFLQSANQSFKQQFISDCVTGADKGIAIPVDDILRSLEQRSTNSEGTARNDYRVALKRILESGDSPDSILAQIKELDANYPGMTITYKDANQNRIIETPYSLFMKTAEKCEQKYVQGGDSKKVERARAALAELKTLNDSFATKVSSGILDTLITCNGSEMKAGSCNESTLSGGQGNPNFCIAHANTCANQIQGCYAEANTQVQTRKVKMENLAKKFNENVATMIAKSNALYEQQKAAVTNVTKLIQQRFPGTNFEIPKDMFVSMPELKKDTFGVELAGDGKLETFLDGPNSMPEKISLLKAMFKSQQTKVKGELDEYISGQEQAMKENYNKWERIASKCEGASNSIRSNIAKANAEGSKRQAEEDSNVGEFCSRFSNLSQNPLGACEDAKDLATDMKKIAGRLDPSVGGNVNAFRQVCNQYMSESENGTESTSTKKNKRAAGRTVSLKSLCVNGEGTGVKSNEDFINALKKSSASLRKAFNEKPLESMITDAENPSTKIEDDDAKDLLDFLRRDYSKGKNIKVADLKGKFKDEDAYNKASLDDSICGNLMKAQIASVKDNGKLTDLSAAAGDTNTDFLKSDGTFSLLKEIASNNSGNIEEVASNLGEKLHGAPCDMQNKTTMQKNTLPWMMNPGAFDQKILGSNSNK